jgi:hypothetical protein
VTRIGWQFDPATREYKPWRFGMTYIPEYATDVEPPPYDPAKERPIWNGAAWDLVPCPPSAQGGG